MATESISCTACLGRGFTLLAGPHDVACSCCSGTGSPRCRDCASAATTVDALSAEHGPACSDCAQACEYCALVSTQLVLVADDQGDCERAESVCDACAGELTERAKRIRKAQRREAYWDAAEDARGAA
jgi:hypothetical protein